MNQIRLTGLTANQPIGAMAAFGLLRRCDITQTFGKTLLSWEEGTEWTALLHVEKACDEQALSSALVEMNRGCSKLPHVCWRTNDSEEISFHEDIKMEPEAFKASLRQAVQRFPEPSAEFIHYLAAYGSEMVVARSTGEIKPTALHMTAGQQRFIKAVRTLAASIDADVLPSKRHKPEQRRESILKAFHEALFGPWLYQDDEHSLGWDPATEALHAYSAEAPTIAGPTSVRGAVWLAFEAMPLFPCVATGTRLATTAFSATGDAFTWPVWTCPISLLTLRSLLVSADLLGEAPLTPRLRARGIAAVFRCRRNTDANGRGQFRPAVLAAGKSAKQLTSLSLSASN